MTTREALCNDSQETGPACASARSRYAKWNEADRAVRDQRGHDGHAPHSAGGSRCRRRDRLGRMRRRRNPDVQPRDRSETAWHILRDHVWPLIEDKEFDAAADVWGMLSLVRGHNMAKGALEAAVWDAEAKQKNMPLWKLLGGTREEIASGVSIGIKDSLDELVAAVKKELDAGYQRIKIKIKPGKDLEQVKRLRQDFPKIKLMVDANSAYQLDDWPRLSSELEGFYLMMIEQPLGWDDLYSHAELQKKLNTPICLDECIHTVEHARAAIALGACKIINIKLGRVGGYTVARKIHDLCQRGGFPVWCGGMLESGIGRAHNIALSTLPNFTLAGRRLRQQTLLG